MKDVYKATEALRVLANAYAEALPDLDVPELDYFIARLESDKCKLIEQREVEAEEKAKQAEAQK